MGAIVDLEVYKIERSLMRVLVSVIFVESLIKYIYSSLEIILGTDKGYVEGKKFDLLLRYTNRAPLGRYLF